MSNHLDRTAFPLGRYLTLGDLCTCTQTYKRYRDSIDPFPRSLESFEALKSLCTELVDPIIDHFGRDQFELTYGFCSVDLKRFLAQKDPETGLKNGRVAPHHDQHMAHEINRKGKYFCDRLGAAVDFRIRNCSSDTVVQWIVDQPLPFDSLYYYGEQRPLHISSGPQHKQKIWAFTPQGTPTRRGTERWSSRSS
ncbi:MAG: hypothetical protein ACO31I_00525 [Prochlorotrichaceae cyanobacterium]|jgi:hypothetical protein